MDKAKLVMKIESYSSKDGMMLLSVDDVGVRAMLKDVVSLCDGKYSGYARIEISPPYRPRTTGEGSHTQRSTWLRCTRTRRCTRNTFSSRGRAGRQTGNVTTSIRGNTR